MGLRGAVIAASLLAGLPAFAGELTAEQAKRLIAGKLFSYTCFDGTTGTGRIMADGSVSGTIQVQGRGPVRYTHLPAGTLRIKDGRVCASLKGLVFQPCFRVEQLNARQWRGSIAGLSFAYCDFTRRSGRLEMARSGRALRSAGVSRGAEE
jgi:hypothetical protein